MKKMTMRERMLAVVRGEPHDRIPFVQYIDVTGFPRPQEVLELLGRGNIGFLRWVNVHRFETPNCRLESEEIVRGGRRCQRRTLVTQKGLLEEERVFDPVFGSSRAASHFVKNLNDYEALMAYLRDIRVVKDLSAFRESTAELGDDGLPHVYTCRTPYQQLWVEWVDIREATSHLFEATDIVSEVFRLMKDVEHRVFSVVCEAVRERPIPYVVFPDNITAPMIGDRFFKAYCVPAYNELACMLGETGRDVPVFVHMDGDLFSLRDAIGESHIRGIDSMSPPPDNDTSVAQALAWWPEMRLLVNFPSSAHLMPPDQVRRAAARILEEGGHSGRLQIQISENVPPDVWRVNYPQIAGAIEEFGPPAERH